MMVLLMRKHERPSWPDTVSLNQVQSPKDSEQETCKYGPDRSCLGDVEAWCANISYDGFRSQLSFLLGVTAPVVGTTSLQNLYDLLGKRLLILCFFLGSKFYPRCRRNTSI